MATTTDNKSHRLPRKPNADKPRPDEHVRKRSGADLQNGWLARHGTLTLTDDRLVFVPTVLDTGLGAKRREIPLTAIETIERFPRNPNSLNTGGKRARMLIHSDECVYELMVPDLDSWIDTLEKMFHLREQRGLGPMPPVLREGVENFMLTDE
jgi:hypothetical protein